MRVSHLEAEMHQVRSSLEVLKHKQKLNDIKEVTRNNFRCCKTLSKVKSMYFDLKFKEAKFDC